MEVIDTLLAVVFVVGLVLGGLLVFGFGYAEYTARETAFENPVRVDGTVQSTAIEEVNQQDDTAYHPNITYTYLFDGTRYTAHTVDPGIYQYKKSSREAAEAFTSNYTVGETTTVFVDPNDPSQAYLKRGTDGWWQTISPYFSMLWGGLMTLVGLAVIYWKLAEIAKNSRRLPL
jgi:hypothetical protein